MCRLNKPRAEKVQQYDIKWPSFGGIKQKGTDDS